MKKFLLLTAGIAGVTYLAVKGNREQIKVTANNLYKRAESLVHQLKHPNTIETKIGHPDPYDTPDNKMVSEGSSYSVNYYNGA
ncbi:hypothetical protein [Heyndrickxia ginsengihumi]|uniref:Uncharacterized protein n=1 Tax=Heyndrickxia ginsengihumi TaxID=363870 RepID=A0A0A6VED8_9BACI|nr:hypothetical protein [Heyndrickxia ginsengihumi]KHD84909.1 hypothetical protein NG54_12605 [Heyndrickxia ginsengihumi]MBE6185558.1 hypothetical protein [Bacillus sp. (in: firmicutes)]MCM3023132.1 hypothetical protein [Heyndrickxia ginsengihumi]NEY19970.1 hypothetical protein [Heyndrickxia ginsengihumi]